MTKYIWPTEGQTFAQAIAEATAHLKIKAKPKAKKKGRPVGSKNKEGHKAGRKDIHMYSPYYRANRDPLYDPANLSVDHRRSQISAG